VTCSTLTTPGSEVAPEAMSAGAVAVITKPRLGLKGFLEESRRERVQTPKAAAQSRPRVGAAAPARSTPAAAARPPVAGLHALSVNKPVVLASSAGGARAIESVRLALPADSPGIAIVQHPPERFTAMYAQRLDGLAAVRVREARDGDRLERGVVLIAPGGRHMQLRKSGGQYDAAVQDGPPVNRHTSSVDVLFRSAAECVGKDALAIILTGMGDGGARGMKALHDGGARAIAQDEASGVVFGMPKEAVQPGAVDEILPLDRVADAILGFDARGRGSARPDGPDPDWNGGARAPRAAPKIDDVGDRPRAAAAVARRLQGAPPCPRSVPRSRPAATRRPAGRRCAPDRGVPGSPAAHRDRAAGARLDPRRPRRPGDRGGAARAGPRRSCRDAGDRPRRPAAPPLPRDHRRGHAVLRRAAAHRAAP
jgi:two-component system chemotaxis response regulator CheB